MTHHTDSGPQKRLEAIHAIQKKLSGRSLSYQEIFSIMDKIAQQQLGDVLTTFFAASFFREGFSNEELYYLTRAMVETGETVKIDAPIIADKHCIGGIAGTRTTMIVVPIVAAAGFPIPKISSRAITSPAGTADVMETLANVSFSPRAIERIVKTIGGCIAWGGQLGIAPADDVIINVEQQLSFEAFDKIIVSIMAKKVAVGTTHLLLDIPIGPTMKIKHKKDAELVAKKFTDLGKKFDMHVICDIDHVFEPSGRGIGPVLEARDVLYVLERDERAPIHLREKALRLCATLLDACYEAQGRDKNGAQQAQRILDSGEALSKFQQIVEAQGGTKNVTSHTLTLARHKHIELSHHHGTVTHMNNYNINSIAKILGAPHDKQAGIMLAKRKGESVRAHEQLFTLYTSDPKHIHEATSTLQQFPIYEIDA